MSEQNNKSVWYISRPSAWPKAPRWMSFSTLSELEVCPRRWALNVADYSHLWEQRGYPGKAQTFALEGTVVHLALEKIAHALAEGGCGSLRDESAFSMLKDLGGYTKIIVDCIKRALQPYEGNPRATPVLEGVRQRLVSRVPEFRTRVQRLLSRIRLASRAGAPLDVATKRLEVSRHQLPHGSHAEVNFQVPQFGWHGVADLLTLSTGFCEIRDFKTGISKPQHEFQLRTYALLWARDRHLNPSGRLADKLVLSYDQRDLEVPAPKEHELCTLEDEIRERTAVALADLQLNPPDARPSQENCAYCTVRQLCEEYWKWNVGQEGTGKPPEGHFTDLQIKVAARHGPTSWDGIVESSSALKVGRPILLRTSSVPFDLYPGQRVRLLDIPVSISKEQCVENEPPQVAATMGTITELFLIPR